MLRVLVVLPLYGGSLPIGRYCAEAFTEAGCLADVFESPSFYSAFSALKELRVGTDRLEYLENSFLQLVSQAILAKVDAFKPDLVFCLAQAPMSRQTLKKLKKDGVPTAMWFVEDYRLFPYWRAFAPYYDIFAVIQKEPFLQELAAIGVENTMYMPLAALPALHRPMDLTPEEKDEYGADVSFLGAGYPNRRRAFLQLAKKGFKIWGTEWEDAPGLQEYLQRGGARISPEEAAKIYNATTINLNLHSSVERDVLVGNGDFVNPRTFELAAAGAFQLVDERSLMPELFADDELARFSTFEELKEKIAYFLHHPEEREAVIEKSRQRVLKDHQYVHRMRAFLEYAKKALPEFGKKQSIGQAGLPEEVSLQLRQLLDTLRLPLDAPLADVAAAVRQKSGVLTDMETSVLFLEEWKRQYCP